LTFAIVKATLLVHPAFNYVPLVVLQRKTVKMTNDADNLLVDADFKAKCEPIQRQLKAMGEHFSTGDMSTYDQADLTVRIDTVYKIKDDF